MSTHRLLVGTAADENTTPPCAPHWGMQPPEEQPAKPWMLRTPDQQRAECHRQRFRGRMEGALIGAVIVLLAVVGSCAVIAKLESADTGAQQRPAARGVAA